MQIKKKKIAVLLYNNLSEEILQKYCQESQVLLIESYSLYSGHHKKKLAFFISSMRHFFEEHKNNFDMQYMKTDEHPVDIISNLDAEEILVFEPADYELFAAFAKLPNVKIIEDPSFICSKEEFKKLNPKVMEAFYRKMRAKTGLLMENDVPVAGKWNFDASNRQKMPDGVAVPTRLEFKKDTITLESIELVKNKFKDNFGNVEPFYFATTRSEALQLLKQFVETYLPTFGVYQDAMRIGGNFLFHSVLAPYLNVGLLSPMEVCEAAEAAFWKSQDGDEDSVAKSGKNPKKSVKSKRSSNDEIEINKNDNELSAFLSDLSPVDKITIESVEGFVRQVIGWREYIRGVYWLQMPEYAQLNHLSGEEKLPDFYWDTNTDMNCLRECISQTWDMAYSHHIQRLMVTGNFAMLLGVKPSEIHQWYLKVYSDAHEWVEMPNTLGMAIYADGGIVGTKPYACSANYINKMSNFCKSCKYNYKERNGPNACPFNYLYWNFLLKHDFSKNPRMFAAYAGLSRLSDEEKEKVKSESKGFISKVCSRKK